MLTVNGGDGMTISCTGSRRAASTALALCCAAAMALMAPAAAAPPEERTIVHAVADADQQRILVRWTSLEAPAPRYTYYEVDRREAGSLSFVRLNDDPIGPLDTAAAIQAVFTAPGRSDALTGILNSLGDDYASDLLRMRGPDASSMDRAQANLLPDLNYGVALAFGLGWLDETVIPGETYVYEVWGLDDLGFRVERLGRATATTGEPPTLEPVTGLECVDLRAQRGDMAVFLRWSENATTRDYAAGYDVLRAPRNADGTCPPLASGLPGVVRANTYPTFSDPPGSPAAGAAAFQTHCASCHPSGRDAAPVRGSTLAEFRRRSYPALWANPSDATHTSLDGIGEETLKVIYDWIQEFEFRDGGDDTPDAPLAEGGWYCYQTVPRDLLGKHGTPSAVVQCQVIDRIPPEPPYNMSSRRIEQGGYEICELAWSRNDAPADDTVEYELYRAADVPRLSKEIPATPIATIAQPSAGARVTYQDTGLGAAGAGESWFYAARARDDAGNLSGLGGWVPCTPRDTAAPPPATLAGACCDDADPADCRDLGRDQRWIDAGGDPDLWYADPRRCPPRVTPDKPGDTYGYRLWRGFDGGSLVPGSDTTVTPIPLDFQPITDTKMSIAVQTYDASGNLSAKSNAISFILLGAWPLPPPHIISAADSGQGKVKLRFRSLQPDRLLGFALYKEYQEGDDPPSASELVVRYHNQNIGGSVGPGAWAIKPGATTLDQVPGFIRTTDPNATNFLYYNDLEQVYVMQANVGELDNLVLRLRALGWTGKEGLDIPHHWNGWAVDTVLDWPRERSSNMLFQNLNTALTVTYSSGPERMTLEWSASNLYGCTPAPDFVVFRRRGGATRWQQISPPFSCDMTAPDPTALSFVDTDVQAGLSYTYTVVRLGQNGEFQVQYGPTTQTAGP